MSNNTTRDQLAYEKPEFLHSPEGRSVRILAEYLDPLREFRLHHIHDTLVFFGSARVPSPEDATYTTHPMARYYDECRELARASTSEPDTFRLARAAVLLGVGDPQTKGIPVGRGATRRNSCWKRAPTAPPLTSPANRLNRNNSPG